MAGFVYIMSNPSFVAGRIKIGKSDRDPTEFRKVELETTGVPEPFKVEYFAFVDDHHSVEKTVHAALDAFRRNKAREFFDIPIGEAVRVIRASSKVHFEKSRYLIEEARYWTPAMSAEAVRKIDDTLEQLSKVRAAVEAERQAEGSAAPQTVEIRCVSCGQRLRVPQYKRGNVGCPKCGHQWKAFLFR